MAHPERVAGGGTRRTIPLLDLKLQHQAIRDEMLREVVRVIDSQQFILGEEVAQFEVEIAAYSRCRFAIGCSSGTDALLLALIAAGIGPGDEVITSPYSFFATASSIHHAGARPVFSDIDAASFNLDERLFAETLASHPKARAVIPVHLFGGCANMPPILAACAERNVTVIEDAAQAIGAECNGYRAGSMGDLGTFSFFPSKNLGAFGDAGLVTTDKEEYAERLRALRVHGSRRKYHHEFVGFNARLDALQAAVLRVKLRYLDSWTNARRRNAFLYRKLLSNVPVCLPEPQPYQMRHIFNQYVIRTPQRDRLQAWLQAEGIGTEIYYPLPLHLQACFRDLGYREGDFPESEKAARESLAIPIYGELDADEIEWIADRIRAFFSARI